MSIKDTIKKAKEKTKPFSDKINKVKRAIKSKTTKFKTKQQENRAKKEVRKALALKGEMIEVTQKLKELKSKDAIEKKRQEIRELEDRLTTSGKILTFMGNATVKVAKTGSKALKESQKGKRKGKKNKDNFWG
jgi:CTP-dependent riboflavin kinase